MLKPTPPFVTILIRWVLVVVLLKSTTGIITRTGSGESRINFFQTVGESKKSLSGLNDWILVAWIGDSLVRFN